MKLTRKPVLIGLCFVVAAFLIPYGYLIFRAERYWEFDRACAIGDTGRVALLLRLGADANGVRDATYYARYHWTVFETARPLHQAASSGHAAVVRLLLANGADPEALNSENSTACDSARIYGHAEVVQLLAPYQHK